MGSQEGTKRLMERELTRRAFLGGAAKTGGALALLGASGGLLAACGGGSTASTSEAAATDAAATSAATTTGQAAGTPVKGGTLTYAVASPPSGFDPAKWWNGLSWDGTLVVFNRLLTLQDDGSVSPSRTAWVATTGWRRR